MITSLTPEQEALLPVVRDEWLAIGLSCEPANRAEAEDGVRMAYEAVNLTPPQRIFWFDSPWAGVEGQARLRAIADLGEGADENSAAFQEAVKKYKRAYYDGLIYGQHDSFFSWIDVAARLGVENLEIADGLIKVAKNAGWWWAFDDTAVMTDRAEYLERDAQGALHSANRMALQYRDGWGLWSWHGRRVPEWVITNPTVEQIVAEENVEIRRCAIEAIGWDQFIAKAELRKIGESMQDPGNPGQEISLYDVPERLWGSPVRLLLCVNGSTERNGTRRRYGLTVPSDVPDPLAAAAWTYRLSREEYAQAVRRT